MGNTLDLVSAFKSKKKKVIESVLCPGLSSRI